MSFATVLPFFSRRCSTDTNATSLIAHRLCLYIYLKLVSFGISIRDDDIKIARCRSKLKTSFGPIFVDLCLIRDAP